MHLDSRAPRGRTFGAFAALIPMLVPALAAAQADAPRVVADAGNPQLRRLARGLPVGATLIVEGLPLEGQGVVDLELERFEVFARDARIEGRGRHGRGGHRSGRPDNAYFRGAVAGMPGSHAVLAFHGRGRLRGLVTTEFGVWAIRPARRGPGIWGRLVDAEIELGGQVFSCGADALVVPAEDAEPVPGQGAQQAAAGGLGAPSYTARIAVETDYEFFALFGDEQDATDYVGDLFAYASSIYQAELDTSLVVSSLSLWTEAADQDPWSTTSCNAALDEVQDYWIDNHAGQSRTVVHMLSGKNMGCGIAYLGVLCHQTYGFGVSASLRGNFDIESPSTVWDALVVTHEIGHNFSSPHTHCYAGYEGAEHIDHCYAGEGGCHSGAQTLPDGCPGSGNGCGTIMSYCHLLSGGYGNITMTLGQGHGYGIDPGRVPTRMLAHVQNRAAVYPDCLPAIDPGCSVDADCDDGLWCTGAETCVDEACVAGVAPDCDDEVSCTNDACDEAADACSNEPDDAQCDDGLWCNGAETCDDVDGCEAGVSPDCGDAFACTTDSCDEAADSCAHAPDDGACDDGLFCNGAETCSAESGCEAGVAPNCGDAVGCTTDACDEAADACTHTPDDTVCNDGLFCNGAETCDMAEDCVNGAAVVCDDGVGCTEDACDEVTDACVSTPDDAHCDNGLFCDGGERCDAANDCQVGAAVACNDGVGCTVDSCDEGADACSYTPADAACDNGLFCDGAETCDVNLDCQPGVDVDCDDAVNCTEDTCDELDDRCVNAPDDGICDDQLHCSGVETCSAVEGCQAGAEVDCGDEVACTVDSCNEATDACDNTPSDAACDDGAWCNGAETCDATGGCLAGAAPDCDDAVGCTADSCNEGTDVCGNLPQDATCDNGDWCDGAETCDAQIGCRAGVAPSCDDGVGCTADSCDEANDACDNVPSDAACDNGAWCDGAETCDAAADCQAGAAPDCNDGLACTADSCDEVGDACANAPDDGACDNGLACDGAESCVVGQGCSDGAPLACGKDAPVCDEGPPPRCVECLVNADCAEGAQICVGSTCVDCQVDADCDNGLFCDGAEACSAGSCVPGDAVDCGDGVACTVDSCNEATDSCDHLTSAALCDDGLFCNGAETCDATAGCQGGVAVDCDDGVACTVDTCDEGADACANAVDDGLCDNGQHCDGAETCDAAAGCQPGDAVDCGDGVACTVDSCNEATDSCDNAVNDGLCDNGLYCDGVETCDAVAGCQAGIEVVCDDGVSCTDDACDESTDRCAAAASDALCDNGQFCDGAETCDASAGCQGGVAVACDDGVACTSDACDEAADGCAYTPVAAACDNGVFCDGAELCDPTLGCLPGRPVDCDDAVECTSDSCDEAAGACAHDTDDALCDNGQWCDGEEACTVGIGCEAGEAPCDGGCDEAADACAGDEVSVRAASWQHRRRRLTVRAITSAGREAALSVVFRVDGVEQTHAMSLRGRTYRVTVRSVSFPDAGEVTVVSSLGGRSTADVRGCRNDGHCSDGAHCTGEESCRRGWCEDGEPPCAEGEVCSETADACGAACAEGADCSDGLFCNGAEACVDGACVAGPPPICDDGVACTVDACDEGADACTAPPDDGLCDNGLACDGAELCDAAQGCQPGDAIQCEPEAPHCDEGPPAACVECLADEDCTADAPVCELETHTCVAPPADEITIQRADYDRRRNRLIVRAVSSDGREARLFVSFVAGGEAHGPLEMRSRRRHHVLQVRRVPAPDPLLVTVTSAAGGETTAAVRLR